MNVKNSFNALYVDESNKNIKLTVGLELLSKYISKKGKPTVMFAVNWVGSKSMWGAVYNEDGSIKYITQFGSKFGDPQFIAQIFIAVRRMINKEVIAQLPIKVDKNDSSPTLIENADEVGQIAKA